MTDSESFSAWMERLDSGDDAAAREVFERFAGRLAALARRQFDRRLLHRVDPEDMVQSAFKSFFVRHREGAFRLGDWEDVWGLLAVITIRKCADRVNYLRAKRRDVFRETSCVEGQEAPWQVALDREPRPDEVAVLSEAIEHLFRGVDEDDRGVVELSLQGFTAAEIGLKLGRALRSVQRLRERIRRRLERYALEGAGA